MLKVFIIFSVSIKKIFISTKQDETFNVQVSVQINMHEKDRVLIELIQ